MGMARSSVVQVAVASFHRMSTQSTRKDTTNAQSTNPWWLDKERVQSENRQYGGRRPVWRLGRAMAEALLYRLHVAAHVRSSPEVVCTPRVYPRAPGLRGPTRDNVSSIFLQQYVSGPSK